MIDAENRRSKTILVLRHVLKFFRLVRRPGLKRSHSANREVEQRGHVRVYSKALVEENRDDS